MCVGGFHIENAADLLNRRSVSLFGITGTRSNQSFPDHSSPLHPGDSCPLKMRCTNSDTNQGSAAGTGCCWLPKLECPKFQFRKKIPAHQAGYRKNEYRYFRKYAHAHQSGDSHFFKHGTKCRPLLGQINSGDQNIDIIRAKVFLCQMLQPQ